MCINLAPVLLKLTADVLVDAVPQTYLALLEMCLDSLLHCQSDLVPNLLLDEIVMHLNCYQKIHACHKGGGQEDPAGLLTTSRGRIAAAE